MNWENSKALTPLKRDFLNRFFEEEKAFFLTGGSALGIFYFEHRLSYDLDLFTCEEMNWHYAGNLLLKIARELNARCRSIISAPPFTAGNP